VQATRAAAPILKEDGKEKDKTTAKSTVRIFADEYEIEMSYLMSSSERRKEKGRQSISKDSERQVRLCISTQGRLENSWLSNLSARKLPLRHSMG
jgi:hypothetical protein